MASYYFVDFENVHLQGLEGIESLRRSDKVVIFCRKEDINKIKMYLSKKDVTASVEGYIVTETTKNAMDFNLVSDLFSRKRRGGFVYIISKDKGFDVASNYALSHSILCKRCTRISEAGFTYDVIEKLGHKAENINFTESIS